MTNSNKITPQKGKENWNLINWRINNIKVFEIQEEIFRLRRDGDTAEMHRKQNELLHLPEAARLAVRRVTQDNAGKKTPGVDGIKALGVRERWKLSESLSLDGKASPIKRVWIPKPGTSEKRPLGIPTIKDRAKQALVKLALEPEWEAIFEPNSYGFRPGRSIQDAIKQIKNCLVAGEKEIFDADIAKCFDRINHHSLLGRLSQDINSTIYLQVKSWLQSGIMECGLIKQSELGTPQGGVISPLLANIALHGLEIKVKNAVKTQCGTIAEKGTHIIRYADDFVILTKLRSSLDVSIRAVQEFLADMGLEVKSSKTRICHSKDKGGLEFLGCQIRQINVGKYKAPPLKGYETRWKVAIRPSKDSVDRLFGRIRHIAKETSDIRTLIERINPIVRGWSEFSKYTDASTLGEAQRWSQRLYMIVSNWLYKNRKIRGKDPKVWKKKEDKDWTLYSTKEGKEISLLQFDSKGLSYSSNRHIKVKGASSPYDGDWTYWGSRNSTNLNISDRKLLLLKRQRGRCKICSQRFYPNDVWQVDHIKPRKDGGPDEFSNLQLLHKECHEVKHSKRA